MVFIILKSTEDYTVDHRNQQQGGQTTNTQIKITKTQKAVLNKEAHQPTKHKNNNTNNQILNYLVVQ